MILTVTLNPSIDISYPLEQLKLNTVNRVSDVRKTAGGKGLNVTRVLAEFKDRVGATGFIGGTNGEFILKNIDYTIQNFFYPIEGHTRNCIAILHEENQTEILEAGPTILKTEADSFLQYFEQLMETSDVVTISGSLPIGLPEDYYVQLIKIANQKGKKVILDCSGKPLEKVLKSDSKPTVIKPNNEELSQLLGYDVSKDFDELKLALEAPLFEKIDWIIVSLGSDGAFAKHGNIFYKVDIPKIAVVNPVGSGDATVAGIASSFIHELNDEELLRRANTFGMLNAQEKITGHINLTNYENLYKQIQIKEV